MEVGESVAMTGVREVWEETGLALAPSQLSLLAVYESVFPVRFHQGPPSDHLIPTSPSLSYSQ